MPAQIHPVFEPPSNPKITIWRYMDFTKFVSMLENNGLFFSRADKLGDVFEGSYSKANKVFRSIIYKDRIPPIAIENFGNFARWSRQWTMVNCWHINQHESAAMWKLYTKSNEAIAIRSTYEKLFNLLDEKCYVGLVKYINYEKDFLPESNAFYPYVHKRSSFSYEQELRAVYQNLPIKDGKFDYSVKPLTEGILKTVDLNALIDAVYLAPTSPLWYKELVDKMVQRYNLKSSVIQSSLDIEPFF